MDNILLLQMIPGFGIVKIRSFLEKNQALINDFNYFEYLVYKESGYKPSQFIDDVSRLKEQCFNLGVKIIHPPNLGVEYRPLLLYIKGDESLIINKKNIAVVGTREPSSTGVDIGSRFVLNAIERGWCIVSGLARGCDKLAHRVTITNGGSTIAVIPMGYRDGLAPWILDRGVFVSEYPPNTKVEKFRCVLRNRIIVGLSKGLFVIEAQEGSGTQHSLKYAIESKIPISYGVGFNGITRYSHTKIEDKSQFDLFLKNCIE